MPSLTHSQQIAMAVIVGQSNTSNARIMAQESLRNAESEENYALATDSDSRPAHISVSKTGVYTFRTVS